jgi:hypothetical protein
MSLGGGETTGVRDEATRHARARSLGQPKLPPPNTPPVLGLDAPTLSTADAAALRSIPAPLTITHETVIDGDDAQALLQLFDESIAPIDAVSATEHSENDDRLLAYFANPGIIKIVAWDGDEPIGLGIITNDLTLISEPSPVFFANRYPDHAARNAIFYGMSVLVKESERGMTAFSRIYLDMWQIPALVNGVLAFDICKFNVESYNAEKIIAGIAANFPNSRWEEVDTQIWYAAVLPEPLR